MTCGNDDGDHRLAKPSSLTQKAGFLGEFQTLPLINTVFWGCNFCAKK